MRFTEEFPELCKQIKSELKKVQKGTLNVRDAEMYFYSVIDSQSRDAVRHAEHEKSYAIASKLLDTSVDLFSELGEYNLALLFRKFLSERFQAEATKADK